MLVRAKRVLVIGGGGDGIGRAIVRALGAGEARVAVADVSAERAREAADELTAQGATAVALVGDIREAEVVTRIVREATAALDGLDVLVTVVGGQVAFVPAVRLHEMADEDWDTVYELNLRYVARAVRETLNVFLEQGTGGAIISVGSVTGFMAAPQQGAYGVMKAGLLSLARTVAAEYSADRIRMNVVAGGAIASAVANQGEAGAWVEEIPVGRLGTTTEMADAVRYLASDSAAYVTGQQIVLDGGVSVRGPFAQ